MIRYLLLSLLLVSTTCRSQINIGPGYRPIYPINQDYSQAYYNDTFFFMVADIKPDMDAKTVFDQVFRGSEVINLGNDMYYSFSKDKSIFTMFVQRTWTKLIMVSTNKENKNMYDKAIWIISQIRSNNGDVKLLSSN